MAGYIGSKASVTQVDGYNQAEADAEFVNDPNGAITVDGSNVGIGTSSPLGKLQIQSSNPDVYITSADTGQSDIYFGGTTAPDKGRIQYSDNSDFMAFWTDNTERMRLEADGDLHVGGNVIAYSTTISDERLKTDIVKIDGALDKVAQLNGYTFTYTADGKKSAGVVAQEVQKVLPSAIVESTLPLKMGDDDETEYMTVQYDQLMGLMIEAIKELKAEVAELKGS